MAATDGSQPSRQLEHQALDPRRETVVPSPTRLPRQTLLDAEHDLSAALAAARASVAHCEAALARLAAELGQDMPSFLPHGAAARADHLSARETQILQFIVRGQSNRAVAEALFLSPRTVERHIANIYCKLRVHNRAEAVRYALEIGRAEERLATSRRAVAQPAASAALTPVNDVTRSGRTTSVTSAAPSTPAR